MPHPTAHTLNYLFPRTYVMDRTTLAGKLIDCGVVSFSRLVRSAGTRKLEPFLSLHPSMLLAYPETRAAVLARLENEITERQAHFDSLAGVDYDSLPWAAWLAARHEKPLLYLREALAETGETLHKLEGFFLRNHMVVCVDAVLDNTVEWVSALKTLRKAYCRVTLLITVLDANPNVNKKSFDWLEIPFHALITLDDVAEVAVERGLVKKAEAARLLKEYYAGLKPVPKPEDAKKKKRAHVHDLDNLDNHEH